MGHALRLRLPGRLRLCLHALSGLLPALTLAAPALAAPPAGAPASVTVKVANPLKTARPGEPIVVSLAELVKLAPGLDPAKTTVTDAAGRPVLSQLVDMTGDDKPDDLLFQTDLAPGESKTFTVAVGVRRPPPRDAYRVYGRFVRERHDDFAWENDRVAHRMYGPDLEVWKAEPLTSSGIDVWCKRVRRLVVNDWYMTDDYHRDAGDGADLYSVNKSRGCGGLGVWTGGALKVSRNFIQSRVLAAGPLRLVFELTYAPWDAGGVSVSETKRVIVDAGRNLDRFESRFAASKPAPLSIGVGIAKHAGGTFEVDRQAGWLRSWEPLKDKESSGGNLGCALVLPPGVAVTDEAETETDRLIVARAGDGGAPFTYHAGAGWDRSGDFADAAAFAAYVQTFARNLAAPVQVSLAPHAAAAAAVEPAARWSARVCDSVMKRTPMLTDRWTYDAGLVLSGFEAVWRASKDRKYLDYVKETVDRLIDEEGIIRGYKVEDHNLDNLNMGKVLFALHAGAGTPRDKDRYRKALHSLRAQIRTQPRTDDGGFWHKAIYPHQMWLDGVYMAAPFLARFAVVFNEPALLDDVAKQILLAERHTRDPRSGLLYHGWDESKKQRWANARTGTSPEFWGRAMGWFSMGLVDVLDEMPARHPKRPAVLAVLKRLATAIARVQDKETGVWWQVLDAGGRAGNYREASASAMFVYALSKAVKRGWIDDKKFGPVAERGYLGTLDRFVEIDPQGQVSIKDICKVAGLGGDPYRDGSFAYYTSTEVVSNDPKGVGAFILASAERE